MNISLLEELKTFFIPAGYKLFVPTERSNKSLELYCQNIESIRSLPLPVLTRLPPHPQIAYADPLFYSRLIDSRLETNCYDRQI